MAAIHAPSIAPVEAFELLESWPAQHVSVGVRTADGAEWQYGPNARVYEWASVTKLATALVTLVAVEEGVVDLDAPAGPPGSTVRHLLAHASGLGPEPGPPIAKPASRRIYSDYGFEVLADSVAAQAEMPFTRYFSEVLLPAGADVQLYGSAGSGARGSLLALLELARIFLTPTTIAPETLAEATEVVFPGLVGVLPGFGRMEPNDWGLGFELRDEKRPHWTGDRNSPRTFGHFGQTGTFLWVDPEAGVACACLTDHDFGGWAKEAWPRLSDAVLAEAPSR
jgi:CubicO group peptidase (beta-lactamase class C family)